MMVSNSPSGLVPLLNKPEPTPLIRPDGKLMNGPVTPVFKRPEISPFMVEPPLAWLKKPDIKPFTFRGPPGPLAVLLKPDTSVPVLPKPEVVAPVLPAPPKPVFSTNLTAIPLLPDQAVWPRRQRIQMDA